MFLNTPKNLLKNIPAELPNELLETLVSSADLQIERIVSKGHASPPDFWYDQPRHEWVLLVEGAARLEFEDGCVDMKRGDYISIPAHVRHRVASTDPALTTVWLAIHHGGPLA